MIIKLFISLILLWPQPGAGVSAALRQDHGPVQTDTSAVQTKLSGYLKTLEELPVSEKIRETDFLIGACRDAGVRNMVTSRIYGYYRHSPLMGDDAVAVHVADEWISAGKASLGSVVADMDARIYADFNRSSLIGCKAPALVLEASDGSKVPVIPGPGKLQILFFYDTGCAVCRSEAVRIKEALRGKKYPAEFIAVYTGTDRDAWLKNVSENKGFAGSDIPIFHYWDPASDSDFRRKYGVLQTPKLFVIDRDGTIAGRSLDAPALVTVLEALCKEPDYNTEAYGAILRQVLSDGNCLSSLEARQLVDYLHDGVASAGSYSQRKQLICEMLYYLWARREPAFKEAAAYVADSLVLSKPSMWSSVQDSLVVVNFAAMVSGLSSKTRIGGRLPAVTVRGRMKDAGKDGKWRLDRLEGPAYVVFKSEGCPLCKEELRLAETCGQKVLEVVPGVQKGKTAKALPEQLDLSSLPLVVHIGKDGKVDGKYLTFKCLK